MGTLPVGEGVAFAFSASSGPERRLFFMSVAEKSGVSAASNIVCPLCRNRNARTRWPDSAEGCARNIREISCPTCIGFLIDIEVFDRGALEYWVLERLALLSRVTMSRGHDPLEITPLLVRTIQAAGESPSKGIRDCS